MNQKQMEAAQEAMVGWLEHPQELGKKPAKIECAGEFDLHEMHYYIFKYKKSMFGAWLLGVCGGYEDDELEHCGHVFSEMKEYAPETAKEDAIAIVEQVRAYFMEQAKKAEEKKEHKGNFVNFVLLKEAVWDKEEFKKLLKEEWQIEAEESPEEDDNTIVFNYHGSMISVGLMPTPIPDGEAEYHARKNYMWKDAEEITKQHQAHLMVAVINMGATMVEAGETLAKVVAACCKQAGVLGVYANEVVYQPEYYLQFVGMVKEGMFPIFNLVWFGLYPGKQGICSCTCGMRSFGYDEMEIIDSKAEPSEILDFLSGIASYVISEDVVLQSGETIGFSADQKIPITKSRGIAVEGDSLKIGF